MVRPLDDIPERPRIDVSATLSQGSALERSLRNAGVSETDARNAVALVSGAIALPSINRGAALNIVLGRRPNKSVPRPPTAPAFRTHSYLRLAISRDGSQPERKTVGSGRKVVLGLWFR